MRRTSRVCKCGRIFDGAGVEDDLFTVDLENFNELASLCC